MISAAIQQWCEQGQARLMETDYLAAESALVQAEGLALDQKDWDALARLYMPLQEARRQRRQRCGEGAVVMDVWSAGPSDQLNERAIVNKYPHGQLLVASWGSIAPAIELRKLQRELGLYVETFLGAVYPLTGGGRAILVVPYETSHLPDAIERPIEDLIHLAPRGSLVFAEEELPRGHRAGNSQTYAQVMDIWERLHRPFLKETDEMADTQGKIEAYRRTIQVDYACELAHQKLSTIAHELARRG